MGIKERKEREKLEIKDKILKAAEELFAESGYSNVSMRKIADRIEYSLPVIYQYFGNKEDILLSLYEKGNGQLYEELLEAAEAQYDNPVERLKQLAQVYVAFALDNKNYYELAFLSNALRQEKSIPYVDKGSNGFKAYAVIYEAVKQCIENGYYAEKDCETMCQMLWAGVHGIVSLLIAHPEFPWQNEQKLIDEIINKLTEGY